MKSDKRIKQDGCVLMLASVASMIGQFNRANIRLMQETGYEVHVACNFKRGNTCSAKCVLELEEELKDQGVVLHQWDCPRKPGAAGCVKAGLQLCSLIKTYHFLWMHCQSPVGAALARVAAHRYSIPVVYTAHGFHFYKGAPLKNWLFYYPIEKILAHWTDILVTVNQEDFRFAKRHLKAGRVRTIPGIGIDTGKYTSDLNSRKEARNILKKYGIPENAYILLSVGELSRRKNQEIVIHALAALGRQDVYYFICGQGVWKKKLKLLADRLGVGSYIKMLGYVENPVKIYHSADIFVFPSRQEGMPVALMEAMATGLPCVVSDIRGSKELLSGKIQNNLCNKIGALQPLLVPGGVRFSLDRPQQLAQALTVLLDNKQLRIKCGTYNKRKIESYSQENVAVQMRTIYRELDSKKRPGGAAWRKY